LLFNSFAFLGVFACLAALYYAVPHRWRWVFLAVASLAYYSTFRPAHVLLLVTVASAAYAAALMIATATDPRVRRALLVVGVAVILGALVTVKYSDFFLQTFRNLLAPLGLVAPATISGFTFTAAAGLSFYTLSCVSYVADVYAGRLVPERHPGYFLTYVAFFPKLLAGPIERAGPFLRQLHHPAPFRGSEVTAGLQLMLWGLFKKVVVADRLAPFVDAAYRQPAFASSVDLVLATYFFAFQLYCDFSGYSDIAIGASKVLGFDLAENFRRPYFARSVPEFWSARWHVSLASWFRDYMYIPLGGNRVSWPRRTFNVLAVFAVSGLWHGASWTFVIWGGLNGLYTAVATVFRAASRRRAALIRVPAFVRSAAARLLTFHLILITWVFFRAASVSDAMTILSRVAQRLTTLPRPLTERVVSMQVFPLVVLVAVLMLVEAVDEGRPIWERLNARPMAVRWAVYYAMLLALVIFGSWNFRQFVYMQF
jgi:D-alanyl-lipoteichoic acid acyltransferase DltB (MBOAT superfamily)